MLDDLLKASDINLIDKSYYWKSFGWLWIKVFKEYFANSSNQIKIINQEYENILNNYNCIS